MKHIKLAFPFINQKKLKAIIYSTPKSEKIKIGNVVFDRHTYRNNTHLVYDALARDKEALKVIGHFTNPVNRKRAEYYPHFNRVLSKGEIKKLNRAIKLNRIKRGLNTPTPEATPEPV